MKINANPRKMGLGAIFLLLSTMVAVVPSFALPYGTSAVSEGGKKKEEKPKAVPEGDVLSMLGLSLGIFTCAAVARRRVV